ncbi:tetraspanin-8, putative [Pediculus humanus corporis]|uniref:Tetraspanin n=1 Tax=Pediculus humanus subsp. corporis TaxID=121224 RepID=E0VMX8_PEDHC|nr:tetraspanin-8, putative [Pediculus humanus corporis]EEB14734.1 tetraspanin-8, putative [Pediculus humanus corporis]
MSCGDGCIKFLLFTFNFIFSLIGLALIVVGSLLLSNISSFQDLVQDASLRAPQIFIIVVGVVIFFIASLGCCGAVRESRCMLITFAVLLLAIFIVQLGVGIYALTHKEQFTTAVNKGLETEFGRLKYNPNIRRLFEVMETEWECCGVKGKSDYLESLYPVPESCCRDKNKCITRPLDYWPRGCAEVLTNFTGKAGDILGGVAIALSVIEIIGAIFALRLASHVR